MASSIIVPRYLTSHTGLIQCLHFIASIQLMFDFGNHSQDASWHKESTQCHSLMIWEVSRFLCAKILVSHGWLTHFFGFIVSFQLALHSGHYSEEVLRHKASTQQGEHSDLRSLKLFLCLKKLRWHSRLSQHFHFIVPFQLMLHFGHHPEDASWHKESTQCHS